MIDEMMHHRYVLTSWRIEDGRDGLRENNQSI